MALRFILFSLIVSAIPWSVLSSQQQLQFDLLTTDNGLGHRNVRFVTRDSMGFLWIVNSDIDYYDGQKFTNYSAFNQQSPLPITGINMACKPNDSLIVFAASKDLYQLNLNTGQSASITLPSGMNSNLASLFAIADRQHHPDIIMMTRTESGTQAHLITRNWTLDHTIEFDKSSSMPLVIQRAYANGPHGVMWFMEQDENRIIKSTADTVISIPFDFHQDPVMYRIVYQPDYGLVICASNGRLHGIRNDQDAATELHQVPINGTNLNATHITSSGRVWVICPDQVIEFSANDTNVVTYPQALFDDLVPPIHNSFEDEEGVTWLSTEIGLLRIQGEPRRFHASLNQPDGARNLQFRDILATSDPNTVIARIAHLNRSIITMRFDGTQLVDTLHLIEDVAGGGMYRESDDYVFTVSYNSNTLKRINKTSLDLEEFALSTKPTTQYYNALFVQNDSMIAYQDINNHITFFNTNDLSSSTLKLEHADSLLISGWRQLELAHRKVFIATESDGLLVYSAATGLLLNHLHTQSKPATSSNSVNTMLLEGDTAIWAGYMGAGVDYIDLNQMRIKRHSKSNDLPDNFIASVVRDQNDNIWIGTYNGLTVFDRSANDFYTYYTRDGLSDNEFNYLASHVLEDGRVLMGTFNGLTVFDPAMIRKVDSLPAVAVTRIQTFNRKTNSIREHTVKQANLGQLVMSPYDNYIEFTFAVPSFKSNEFHNYYARIAGSEESWQDLGRNNVLRYQRLAPGQYTLELRANDIHGNEVVHATNVNFYVSQAYYKSTWFIVSMFVVICILGYLFYRYRLKLLRKEHQTRTRIASDLHDEIGSALTGLSLQLQMFEMADSKSGNKQLSYIGDLINESVTKMRDLVWSFDARSDSWGKITERMHDAASDLLFPRDIAFDIQIEGFDLSASPSPILKQNVFLIYKEALTNIAKHSKGDSVKIHLVESDGQLHLRIKDNGKKSSGRNGYSGQGVQNMQMRAGRLNGAIFAGYTSSEGCFLVDLKCPI